MKLPNRIDASDWSTSRKLRHTASYLRSVVSDSEFDMWLWSTKATVKEMSACGTAACVAGHMVMLFQVPGDTIEKSLCELEDFLGITYDEGASLFLQGFDKDRYAKAAELDALAEKYEALEAKS